MRLNETILYEIDGLPSKCSQNLIHQLKLLVPSYPNAGQHHWWHSMVWGLVLGKTYLYP